MNRFALLSLYRSLTRHKLYAALNIGGLAVGIAVFLVLSLYVRFETSYDKWLPEHEKIYTVQSIWNFPGSPFNGPSNSTMSGLLEQIQEDFPGVVGTRIGGGESSVLRGGVAVREDVAEVDPSFFDVFRLPMARGDGATVLKDPTGALLSETIARKYFGNSDPVGQTITIASKNYRVGGVFRDLPKNSEFKLGILVPMPRVHDDENWYRWGGSSLQTFLRFETPEAARVFEQKLPAFVARRGRPDLGEKASDHVKLALLPVARQHLEPQLTASSSRKITIVTLGLVGLLTLLIAIVNYVNLATARAGLRAREVAMRKVLGADQGALVKQFLGEAVLTVALAALIGLMLAELGLPLVNAAGGHSLTIPYGVVVPALALLVLVVGIAAGIYPALLLSRFPAAAVLASARAPGGGRAGTRIREALVVFQFGLAIAFIVGTLVLFAQTRHVQQADLGFQREGLLIVRSMGDSALTPAQRRAVGAAIRRLPGVESVALGDGAAGGTGQDQATNLKQAGTPGLGTSVRWIEVGPSFFQTYGARVIAGRLFDEAHGADDAAGLPEGQARNIVINRRAVTTLGFRSPQDAIGKSVGGTTYPRTIIGVVDDMRFYSPREPNSAAFYIYFRQPEEGEGRVATVRFQGDPRAMLAAMRSVWQRTVPQVPFDADTADARLALFYSDDQQATQLFAIGAGLAVLIGCVGLWGLASFNTARRVKEIGIRKTLGASATDIVKLLVGEFLRPVLLANLIGWPLAFVAARTWLAGFDDPVGLSPLFFLVGSLVATIVAVVTVIGQSLRASRAAPAWALRHD
jgi:putative ABC transport system permease protein